MKTAYLVVAIFAIMMMTHVRSDAAAPAADTKKSAAPAAPAAPAATVIQGRPDGWRSDWTWRNGWSDDLAWDGRWNAQDDFVFRGPERRGWNGVPVVDWNRDGVIDWKDSAAMGWGAPTWGPRRGEIVKADWNGDGVIDARDGWRRLGEWNGGAWDPSWRGNGWRADTVSVREVPAGAQWKDSDWRSVEGWDTPVWTEPAWTAPTWTEPAWTAPAWGWDAPAWGPRRGEIVRADWNGDGVIDAKDGWRRLGEWNGGAWDPSWRGNGWRADTVSVREVPAGAQWKDSDWRSVEGWDTPVWTEPAWTAPTWTEPAWTAPAWGWDAPAWGPRRGEIVRADWNGDGVIDAKDGWRRLGEWTGGAWDPSWRGNGWRADTVSVREVPAGAQWRDSDWRSIEGWDTPVWTEPAWTAPTWNEQAWTAPAWGWDAPAWGWDAPAWGWEAPVRGWQEPVRVREVPAGWTGAATTTTKPVETKKKADTTQK